MRPPDSVLGHALYPVDAGFVFEPGKDPLPAHRRHDLADATQLAFRQFDDLETPAAAFGIALIHPQEIAREKRGLVAAGAGTDFEDRGARVGGIPGQECQAKLLLDLGKAGAQGGKFLFRQIFHFRIGQHRLGLADIGQRLAVLRDRGHDRFQFRVFPGQRRDFIAIRARRHLRLEILETFGDLRKSVQRNHGRAVAYWRPCVKEKQTDPAAKAGPGRRSSG